MCDICGEDLVFGGADEENDEVYWICPNHLREDHLRQNSIEGTEHMALCDHEWSRYTLADGTYYDVCYKCGSAMNWQGGTFHYERSSSS